MFVELHILQNFAPSNLNRDDTGSPKDCDFGGHRRARISSQCLKRAIRREAGFAEFLEENQGGVRTRNLMVEIAKHISGNEPPSDNVIKIVSDVFAEGGITRATPGNRTGIILFVERPAIAEIADKFQAHWQELEKGDRATKTKAREDLGQILAKAVKAPDIGMFGRMIEVKGDTPFGKLQLNVDAASQVAHAISTNRVSMELDYFTAMEELPQSEERGAGFLDSAGFNSACFYRYANVDTKQLETNLGGDRELAVKTVDAFLRASVAAIPTGKQNSMAAHNPPSFILAVVRESGFWNLANAFLQPVRQSSNGDLVQQSVKALDSYWGRLSSVYGDGAVVAKAAVSLDADGLESLADSRVATCEELYQKVQNALQGGTDNGRAQ